MQPAVIAHKVHQHLPPPPPHTHTPGLRPALSPTARLSRELERGGGGLCRRGSACALSPEREREGGRGIEGEREKKEKREKQEEKEKEEKEE